MAILDPKMAAACPPLRALHPEMRTPVRTAVDPKRAATAPPLAAAEEQEDMEAVPATRWMEMRDKGKLVSELRKGGRISSEQKKKGDGASKGRRAQASSTTLLFASASKAPPSPSAVQLEKAHAVTLSSAPPEARAEPPWAAAPFTRERLNNRSDAPSFTCADRGGSRSERGCSIVSAVL